MKRWFLEKLGPPWLARRELGPPRPFFGLLRGSGGPRVRTERLVAHFGNHFFRPNLLYSSSSGLIPAPVIRASRGRRFRPAIVHNQNGIYFPAWYSGECQARNRELAEMAGAADHVIFQSRFCEQAYRERVAELPGSREVLLNPSPDLANGAAPGWQGRIQLLVAGNFSIGGEHALLPALLAFRKLAPALDAELLILGDGLTELSEQEGVRSAWKELCLSGLEKQVRWLGTYTLSTLPKLIHGMPIALHLRYKDACPNAVAEKLSLGIPHVFSQSGGTPEVVGGAGVGIAVGDGWDQLLAVDVDALAGAVEQVAARHAHFATAARKQFSEKLSLQPYLRRHEELFARVLQYPL